MAIQIAREREPLETSATLRVRSDRPHDTSPRFLESGMFLLTVAAPLMFFPQSVAPFASIKLTLLAIGALLVWLSRIPPDRRFVVPSLVWVGVLVAATLFGTDPWGSLLGAEEQSTGLLALIVCACVLVVGPNVPVACRDRVRTWLAGAGAVMAMIAVLAYLAPGVAGTVVPGVSLKGSTMGNPVLVNGFLAVAAVAVLGAPAARRTRMVPVLALIASGIAVSGERSAIILPALVLVAWIALARPPRAAILTGVVTFVLVLAVWAVIPAIGSPSASSSTVRQFQTLTGERQRLAVSSAVLRGGMRRPLLGWGSGNTWSGFVSSATPEEIATAGRGWGDAHNALLEIFVTTGFGGLGVFLLLVIRTGRATLGAPTEQRWTLVAAVVLSTYHLFEPLNVVLTPLAFLLAGMSAKRSPIRSGAEPDRPPGGPDGPEPLARGRGLRPAAVTLVLCGATILAATNLGASALEQWGRGHFGDWSLRASLTLQRWRTSTAEALAISLALDGRGGDREAASEARHLIGRTVRQHPWDPGVRLVAADVELLLHNPLGAQEWIRAHLRRFPSDARALEEEQSLVTIPALPSSPPS